MGKRKILAGLFAGVLVTTATAALTISPTNAAGGGSDAIFTPNNPNNINVPDLGNTSASAVLANGGGVITDVNLKLNDLTSTYPDDLDIELVGPTGRAVEIMSDACFSSDVSLIDLTFDDQAASALPDNPGAACTSGTYKPSNYVPGDTYPTPLNGANLAAFNGTNPNGTWTLRLVDDATGDTSSITGGFQLTINTAPFSILVPGTGTSGPASPYPFQFVVSGKPGLVADVNVVLKNVTHQFPDDLNALLVAPSGQKALILNDACGGGPGITEVTLTFDDEAAADIPNAGPCPAGSYRPKVYDATQTMPAPAPAGPYVAPLSTFDGINPNGTWSLYIADDAGGDYGFLSQDPELVIGLTDTTPPDTKLSGKKPENTTKTKAKIKFTSTEAGSTFKCKVDSAKYKPCTSPLKLKNLALGKHKVLIVATDAAGNSDPKALKIKWKVFPKN